MIANTKSLEVNSEGNPWKVEYERPDLNLRVFYSSVKGSSFRRFKAVCTIPYDVSTIRNFLADDQSRLTWDRNIQDISRIIVKEDADKREKIFVLRCATKQVGPISGRDFVDACAELVLEDGSVVNGGGGIPLEVSKFPATRGFVRGYNHPGSGWHFEPDPEGSGGTRISYVIHCDLKGWFLPLIINNAIGGSYATFFEDLQGALKKHCAES